MKFARLKEYQRETLTIRFLSGKIAKSRGEVIISHNGERHLWCYFDPGSMGIPLKDEGIEWNLVDQNLPRE